MTMELHGTVENGILKLSLTQLKQRESFLNSMKDGCRVIESLTVERKPKSYQQVKTHWGLVITTILMEFSDRGWDSSTLLNLPVPTGIEVTKGMLQEYLYAACPVHNEEGQRVTLSKMNTLEASQFFEMVRNFAASQWSIYIPEPDPNWKEDKE